MGYNSPVTNWEDPLNCWHYKKYQPPWALESASKPSRALSPRHPQKKLEAAMIIAWGQTCGNIAVSILIALIPEYLWIQYLWISMDIWAWVLQIAMAVCNPWASSERGVRCARAGVGLVTLPDRQSDIGICQGWDKYDHAVVWVKQ